MLKHPALAPFASQPVGGNTYVSVVYLPGTYGILVVTKERGGVSKMPNCFVLWHRRCAARVRAGKGQCGYQRDLAKERDRLRLLPKLTTCRVAIGIKDVFRAASASIRSYFANEFTGVWLIERETNQLQSVLLIFQPGRACWMMSRQHT
jgi:hypothetical protein